MDQWLYATVVALPGLLAVLWLLFYRRFVRGRTRRSLSTVLAGNLVVLLLLGSLVFAVAESWYRFAPSQTDSFGLTLVMERWTAEHDIRNNMGFRDDVDYSLVRDDGRHRISFLGDSFTAGHGIAEVNDRFVNLLRARHPEWEVHSLAQNGFDTGRQIQTVRQLASNGYALDVLVLVYCLNDTSDILDDWKVTVADLRQRAEEAPFLVRHSYAVNTWYHRLGVAKDPNTANYFGFVLEHYQGDVWKQQARRLTRLHELVEQKGGRFLVVTFPFLHDLGPDYAFREVHRRLDEFWAEQGVPHLDLLSVYDGRRAEDIVVSKYDSHPNEGSHAEAADAIERFLEEQLR